MTHDFEHNAYLVQIFGAADRNPSLPEVRRIGGTYYLEIGYDQFRRLVDDFRERGIAHKVTSVADGRDVLVLLGAADSDLRGEVFTPEP